LDVLRMVSARIQRSQQGDAEAEDGSKPGREFLRQVNASGDTFLHCMCGAGWDQDKLSLGLKLTDWSTPNQAHQAHTANKKKQLPLHILLEQYVCLFSFFPCRLWMICPWMGVDIPTLSPQ